jgi:FAD/FMN-containing dehydrogenases
VRSIETIDQTSINDTDVHSQCGEAPEAKAGKQDPCWANDTHSKLNLVHHREVWKPKDTETLNYAIKYAEKYDIPIALAGGRHSMGGQQFVNDGLLLDMRHDKTIISLDAHRGLLRVQPGIMWNELVESLDRLQSCDSYLQSNDNSSNRWSIVQKPTGADNITIGGCVSSNVHGRGLKYKPFVQDIESLDLLTASGDQLQVDRKTNSDLFRLVIGGYGLFGIITSVTLRLRPRTLMQRIVTETTIDRLMTELQSRIDQGHEYGDFQFAIDDTSPDYLRKGILATYREAASDQIPENQRKLTVAQWTQLLELTHTNKSEAYERYAEHYLATSGQLYYSDTMQLSTYVDDYHDHLCSKLGSPKATEVISEVYVPREQLASFMCDAAEMFKRRKTSIIYGTIRLIEQDDETFLAWAKKSYACIIFNLHTEHSTLGQEASAAAFRELIDLAHKYGGAFYLTYHRHARKDQIESIYPQFEQFLKLKRTYDPQERFSSEWYQHYQRMFS